MKLLRWLVVAATCALSPGAAKAEHPFWSHDPLAPRDYWGLLHQPSTVNETDFEPRETWRLFYYNKSGRELMKDRAYVGALQTGLRRNGYYCGAIDGVYTDEVSDAIAKLQKNYGMRVDGYLTVSVRRALRLP
jgi:hypothetical protein